MNHITTGKRVAYGLAVWPETIIFRRTLRAMLPTGQTRSDSAAQHWKREQRGRGALSNNNVSDKFQVAVRRFDSAGLIERGTEFIRIVDRQALCDRALLNVPDPSHTVFLLLDRAIAEVERQLRTEHRDRVLEIRQHELQILRNLKGERSSGGVATFQLSQNDSAL